MNLNPPPREVPKGLPAAEYFKLSIRYLIMGWTRNALRSGRIGLDCDREQIAGTPLAEMTPSDYQFFARLVEGLDNGVSFSESLLRFSRAMIDSARETVRDSVRSYGDRQENDVLKLIRFGFEESFKGFSKTASDACVRAAETVFKFALPQRELPQNLSVQEYLGLGQRYLNLCWSEQARDAFEKVIEISPDSSEGQVARRLIRTRLPREPVPYLAIQGYNEARRASFAGSTAEAIETLQSLIDSYPSFEWPYTLLAEIYTRQARLFEAGELVEHALSMNPSHVSCWILKAKLAAINGQVMDAQSALDRACDLDNEDGSIAYLRQLVSMMSRL